MITYHNKLIELVTAIIASSFSVPTGTAVLYLYKNSSWQQPHWVGRFRGAIKITVEGYEVDTNANQISRMLRTTAVYALYFYNCDM